MQNKSRTVPFWLLLLGVMLMANVSATEGGGRNTAAAQGHADIIAYHMAGLPDPVVIYAYDAKGTLLRVFGANGKNGFSDMEKMRAAIASGTIAVATDIAPGTDTKLRHFLAAQNIRPETLISGGKPYSLILVVPDTHGAPCPPCANYRAMLADATTRPAAEDRFSVYTLKLGAPGAEFRVAK